MKIKTIVTLLLMAMVVSNAHALSIVKDGKANAVVVLPNNPNKYQSEAAADFVERIKISTGQDVEVVIKAKSKKINPSFARIYIGDNTPSHKSLAPEEFVVEADGEGNLYVGAQDRDHLRQRYVSRVTMWALSYIMEEYMGVRWLWPGETGTVTPSLKDITIPDDLNYSYQPALVKRRFDLLHGENEELLKWCARNQMAGQRNDYLFQHSFRPNCSNGDWRADFLESDPDMLAQDPNGKPTLSGVKSTFYKICVSNPKCADEVIRRWKMAGKPDYWDVTPNDGVGFCTCENCQALDYKYNEVKYTKKEIWTNKDPNITLSGRYVWFWNQLITRMRRDNPKVEIGVFLYSAYKKPPKNLKLEEGVIGEMCDGFDFENWENWIECGISGIAMRPNWLYMGACGPNLLLHRAGSYMESARENSMKHLFMDALHEHWATQGPYYYLTARLFGKPDMTTDEVIDEYCESFGAAAPVIKEYLEYWERYHDDKVRYNIPAGGNKPWDLDGFYESECRRVYGSSLHPLKGHWVMMPYIYTDEMQSKAREILGRASDKVSDEVTLKRIDFLREGLNMMDVVIDFVNASSEDKNTYLGYVAKKSAELREKFGYWGGTEIKQMQRFKVADPSAQFDDM